MDEVITKLTEELKGCVGRHMLKFNEDQYQEMVGTIVIALAFEVARFKHFVVSGKEVSSSKFDIVFREKVLKYYDKCNQD